MKLTNTSLILLLAASSLTQTAAQDTEENFTKTKEDPGALSLAKQPGAAAATARPKISPKVLQAAASAEEPVRVMILYKHQPQAAIQDRVESLAAPRRELLRAQAGRAAGNLQAEAHAVEALERSILETRATARREILSAIGPMQSVKAARLEAAGATSVRRFWMQNAITAEIPASALAMLEEDPDVAEVLPVGVHRVSAFTNAGMDPTTGVMGVAGWWNAGFTGAGQQVVILDTGINAAHPIFAGKQVVAIPFLSNARRTRCFADDADSARDNVGHGSHVAGIAAGASDSLLSVFQGTGRGVNRIFALKVGARFSGQGNCGENGFLDSDIFEGVQWAFENTSARVYNMSFGGSTSDDDSFFARLTDAITDIFGITVVVSAGNSGAEGIGDTGLTYNGIVVANMDTRGTLAKTDDRIAASSSRGPTPGGRFKPDVAAPGTAIPSAAGSGSSLVRQSGTSMAAPKVAGAVAILHQAGIQDPAAVKALLINSTDHVGWKSDRGWGFVNLDNARAARSVLTGSVEPGRFQLFRGRATGDLFATLAWNRHMVEGESIFHDLDLSVFDTQGARLGVSESSDQNVEQVAVEATGDVLVKVKAFNEEFRDGRPSENFAVAIANSGFVPATGPVLSVRCTPSTNTVVRGSAFNLTCSVSNQGDFAGNSTVVELRVGGTAEPVTNEAGILEAGQTRSGTFRLTAPAQPGTMDIIFRAGTSAAGEVAVATTRVQIPVR